MSMIAPRWQALLEGESARIAHAAAADILEALMRHGASVNVPTLAGHAGLALTCHYADAIVPGRGYDAAARQSLESAVQAVGETPMAIGLYDGCAGIGWVLEHLTGGSSADEADPNDDFDDALLEHVEGDAPCGGEYDLISGIVGIGVYFLERCARPSAVRGLERVVQQLARTATPESRDRLTWFTAPERLPSWQRGATPRGLYNLGVPHGVPGVIALLAQIVRAPVVPADVRGEARRLLDGAVAWLLAQRLADTTSGHFPSSIAPGLGVATGRRVAWCYGDLGVAATLLLAARLVGEPAWEDVALRVAHDVANVPVDSDGTLDAALCHGAIGNAHLFNRLYHASGDAVLAAAARSWYERALAMRGDGGIGGYRVWGYHPMMPSETPEARPPPTWVDSLAFLDGAAGIALALLAAVSDADPAWDRLLLVSAHPLHEANCLAT